MGVRFISAAEAALKIRNGDTVLNTGFTMMGVCEEIFKAIEQSYLTEGSPRDLTLVHAAGASDKVNGLEHWANDGLIKRVIGAHWGLAPKMREFIFQDRAEGFCLPQGKVSHLIRAMGGKQPGVLSKVGLGTFVDPRLDGGAVNASAKASGLRFVELKEIDGEEYLFYKAIPINVALIRGTTIDENGNLTCEHEGIKLEIMSAALAAKRFGGIVIAQAKYKAKAGTLHPQRVVVPGLFIDYAVIAQDPVQNHRMTNGFLFEPSYAGDIRVPVDSVAMLPLSARKVIGRRGIMEAYPGASVNLGTGIPGDTVGPVSAEEGIADSLTLTIESGAIGGVPAGGVDFGLTQNAEAIIEQPYQFDFYNGMGVDVTYMGAAEVDEQGNVNVSKFGGRVTGCGGFIDITQSAKKVVFLCSFTAGKADIAVEDGELKIRSNGGKKFLKRVEHITFAGQVAAQNDWQEIIYVTERAVFRLDRDGLVLTEVAPGCDLERDIFAHMEFRPKVAADLKTMDRAVFAEGPMGIRTEFLARTRQ
ncbi:MAG TPA: CoA-transferase [Symbiobacteriaceae bacterium]|nr:CoA-transferase [Symbiobacteriaceae bacterium]